MVKNKCARSARRLLVRFATALISALFIVLSISAIAVETDSPTSGDYCYIGAASPTGSLYCAYGIDQYSRTGRDGKEVTYSTPYAYLCKLGKAKAIQLAIPKYPKKSKTNMDFEGFSDPMFLQRWLIVTASHSSGEQVVIGWRMDSKKNPQILATFKKGCSHPKCKGIAAEYFEQVRQANRPGLKPMVDAKAIFIDDGTSWER